MCADCTIRARISKKPPRRVHVWARADWPSIKSKLLEFQTEFLTTHATRTVEENYNSFKSKVQSLINSHIPIKMTSSRTNMPWFNNTLNVCAKRSKGCSIRLKDQDQISAGNRQDFSGVSPLLQKGKLITDRLKRTNILNTQRHKGF